MQSTRTKQCKSWLEHQLKVLAPGTHLPTGNQLAERFGISRITVTRLLIQFKLNGRIERIPGKGTFVPREDTGESTEVRRPKSASEHLADTIYESICWGEFRQGEALPSVKLICIQFNVAAMTVTSAYRILEKRRIVRKIGKTYWIGSFRELVKIGTTRDIYMFRCKSKDFQPVFQTDSYAPAYQKFERELLEYGYTVRYESSDNLPWLLNTWQAEKRQPAGICFYRLTSKNFSGILPYIKMLEAHKGAGQLQQQRPRILVDWEWGSGWRDLPRNATILSRGNVHTAAARAVARYLLENGYREAVLCIDEKAYCGRVIWSMFKIFLELRTLNPDFKIHQVVEPFTPSSKDTDALERIFKQEFDFLLTKTPFVTAADVKASTIISRDIFKACRSYPGARIWICSTSSQAAAIYAKARSRGISIPDDISLISMQNAPEYYHLGISTCMPDPEKIGYLMAHALIGDLETAKTTKGFIRISCKVIDKLTTRVNNRHNS